MNGQIRSIHQVPSAAASRSSRARPASGLPPPLTDTEPAIWFGIRSAIRLAVGRPSALDLTPAPRSAGRLTETRREGGSFTHPSTWATALRSSTAHIRCVGGASSVTPPSTNCDGDTRNGRLILAACSGRHDPKVHAGPPLSSPLGSPRQSKGQGTEGLRHSSAFTTPRTPRRASGAIDNLVRSARWPGRRT